MKASACVTQSRTHQVSLPESFLALEKGKFIRPGGFLLILLQFEQHCLSSFSKGYGDTFYPQQRLWSIVEYVREQQRKYMELEKTLMTDSQIDPRVDVCLYFLPPHRLKEIDLEFMYQLSRVVPLIPLISKADSMTTDELAAFHAEIQTRTADAGVNFFKFSDNSFDAMHMPNHERAQMFRPFAIVSSERSDNPALFWPIREYQWGICEGEISLRRI